MALCRRKPDNEQASWSRKIATELVDWCINSERRRWTRALIARGQEVPVPSEPCEDVREDGAEPALLDLRMVGAWLRRHGLALLVKTVEEDGVDYVVGGAGGNRGRWCGFPVGKNDLPRSWTWEGWHDVLAELAYFDLLRGGSPLLVDPPPDATLGELVGLFDVIDDVADVIGDQALRDLPDLLSME